MASLYNAAHITLHVRKSNRAAISLYRDSLGFEVTGVEKAYCKSFRTRAMHLSRMYMLSIDIIRSTDADGEDAYQMTLKFEKE
jgi:ribosomal protein S18 acetylase RimI-like enzyme